MEHLIKHNLVDPNNSLLQIYGRIFWWILTYRFLNRSRLGQVWIEIRTFFGGRVWATQFQLWAKSGRYFHSNDSHNMDVLHVPSIGRSTLDYPIKIWVRIATQVKRDTSSRLQLLPSFVLMMVSTWFGKSSVILTSHRKVWKVFFFIFRFDFIKMTRKRIFLINDTFFLIRATKSKLIRIENLQLRIKRREHS